MKVFYLHVSNYSNRLLDLNMLLKLQKNIHMFKEYAYNILKHTITLTARSKLLCRPTFILRLCRQLSFLRRKMKVSITAIFNGICLAFYRMNRMFVLCIMFTIMSCYNSRVTLDCV